MEAFENFNAALPPDFLLVHLNVPVETAMKRAEARGKGLPATRWRKGRDPVEVMSETEGLITKACDLRRARGCAVIEIDGSLPIQEGAKLLIAALASP